MFHVGLTRNAIDRIRSRSLRPKIISYQQQQQHARQQSMPFLTARATSFHLTRLHKATTHTNLAFCRYQLVSLSTFYFVNNKPLYDSTKSASFLVRDIHYLFMYKSVGVNVIDAVQMVKS